MEKSKEGLLSKVWKKVFVACIVIILIEGILIKDMYTGTGLITFMAWGFIVLQFALVIGIEYLRKGFVDRCPYCRKNCYLKYSVDYKNI